MVGNDLRQELLHLRVPTVVGKDRSQIALGDSMLGYPREELSQQGFGAGIIGRLES